MTKFIPLEKQSKKAQKAYNAKQRGNWCGVRPVCVTFSDKSKHSKAARSREKAALRAAF